MNLKMYQTIAEYDSPLSGKLLIKRQNPWDRTYYISTDRVTQSGSIVKTIWQPIIKKFGKKHKSWLVLGVAGGTVLELIAKHTSPVSITGVEIDPVMLDIGKKYFNLSRIPNLELVTADAKTYIASRATPVDIILVDIYVRDQLPAFIYSPKFLTKLKQLGHTVIFNHLYYEPAHFTSVKSFVATLSSLFPDIKLQRQNLNMFIICAGN